MKTKPSHITIILQLLLLFIIPNFAHPDSYRASVGYTFNTFTKVSDDGSAGGSAPIGVELGAGYFFADNWSADGIFELNLETKDLSSVFTGGGAVVSYYIYGGGLKDIIAESFTATAQPRLNLAIFAGASGKSFNFSAFDASAGKAKKTAKNNTPKGAVIGTLFGANTSMSVNEKLRINVITKFFKGLKDDVTPAITTIGFGFGTEILL